MKNSELKQLRDLVAAWDEAVLTEPEFALFGTVAEGLAKYDYEMRTGHPATERICIKCGVPASKCYC